MQGCGSPLFEWSVFEKPHIYVHVYENVHVYLFKQYTVTVTVPVTRD
jgi:hypothetical protein